MDFIERESLVRHHRAIHTHEDYRVERGVFVTVAAVLLGAVLFAAFSTPARADEFQCQNPAGCTALIVQNGELKPVHFIEGDIVSTDEGWVVQAQSGVWENVSYLTIADMPTFHADPGGTYGWTTLGGWDFVTGSKKVSLVYFAGGAQLKANPWTHPLPGTSWTTIWPPQNIQGLGGHPPPAQGSIGGPPTVGSDKKGRVHGTESGPSEHFDGTEWTTGSTGHGVMD